MPARLLIIALDGADSRRLDAWSADGTLPTLGALRRGGSTHLLARPASATDDSLWASFQYGVDQGEHGRLFYHALDSDGEVGWIFQREDGRETFWDRLGAQGLRTAILDVPKCAEIKPVNGIHLVDWLVHGRYYNRPRSAPQSLAADVIARFGAAPPSRCGYRQAAMGDDRVRESVAHLRTSVDKKRAAALHYMATEPWDLFVVGFKEAHCAGHGLWNFVDPDHPEFDAARSERLGWPVQEVFQAIDAAIGDVVAAAGADAEVVVFTTTAMEPNGVADHLFPQIVRRLNAALSGRPSTSFTRTFDRLDAAMSGRAADFLERALKRLDATLCGRPTRRVERGFARVDALLAGRPARWLRGTFRMLYGDEPRTAPLMALPYTDNVGAFRLTGAAPTDPAARARLVERACLLLGELTDRDTGLPVVRSCSAPSVDHQGARAAALPDLVIHYRSGLVPYEIGSARLGRMRCRPSRPRPGNHAAGGLAIAHGRRAVAEAGSLTALRDFAAFATRVLEAPTGAEAATGPDEKATATA
jgi:hypothetical protein